MAHDPDTQRIALECLKLAVNQSHPEQVELAESYLAFVTGTDIDDARAKLAAVRQAAT